MCSYRDIHFHWCPSPHISPPGLAQIEGWVSLVLTEILISCPQSWAFSQDSPHWPIGSEGGKASQEQGGPWLGLFHRTSSCWCFLRKQSGLALLPTIFQLQQEKSRLLIKVLPCSAGHTRRLHFPASLAFSVEPCDWVLADRMWGEMMYAASKSGLGGSLDPWVNHCWEESYQGELTLVLNYDAREV